MAPGRPRGAGARRGAGGTEAPRRTGSPGGQTAVGPGPRSGSPPLSSCRGRRGRRRRRTRTTTRRTTRRTRTRKGTARRSPSPYRVVYPPHQDAEQRIAGPKELHFLRYEVLLLGLGLARQDGGPQVAGGRHGRRLCPLHRRAPEAGDPPSLHAGPGRQLHPPRRRPRRAVPRSGRRHACPALPAVPALPGWRGRLRSARAPARFPRPPRLRAQPAAGPGAPRAASALGAGVMTQGAGGQQLRRRRAGRGARGAAAGPLSCAFALRLCGGLAAPGSQASSGRQLPAGPGGRGVGVRRGEREDSRKVSLLQLRRKEGRMGRVGRSEERRPQTRWSGEGRRLGASPLTGAKNQES